LCGGDPDPLVVDGPLNHGARDRVGMKGQFLDNGGRYPDHRKLQSQEFETVETGKI
jgi:hypothetical protein